jgi:hypothetical protein
MMALAGRQFCPVSVVVAPVDSVVAPVDDSQEMAAKLAAAPLALELTVKPVTCVEVKPVAVKAPEAAMEVPAALAVKVELPEALEPKSLTTPALPLFAPTVIPGVPVAVMPPVPV